MSKKIKGPWLILAVIAGGAILTVSIYRKNHSLLDMATEVRARACDGAIGNYAWIDNHTYLTTIEHYPRTHLLKVDIQADTKSVCASFSLPPAKIRFRRILMSAPGTLSFWLHAGTVSPDGQKALWNSTDGWQLVDPATGNARSLGTGTANNVPNPRDSSPMENAAWMPNSRDWAAVSWDFTKPSMLTIRDLSGHVVSKGAIGHASGMQYILGVLPGDIVLLSDFQRLYKVDTRHGFATRFGDVSFPEDDWVDDAALSPDGRHIAWSCEKRTDWPRIPGPLGRVAPYSPTNLMNIIFISDSDGRHLREAGRYSRVQTSGIPGNEHIADMAWLPDGRHISFTFHDKLWTMPVDAR